MSYSLSRDAAIRLLLEAKILEEIEAKHENKAGVVRYVKNGIQHMNSGQKFCCLRISKNALIRLYNTKREYSSMSHISALYSLGLGVPKSTDHAQFWYKQSYGGCNCPAFKQYAKELKSHLKETISDSFFVYSNDVRKQSRLLEYVRKNGAKCAIVYKSSVSGYVLHNIVVEGGSLIHIVKANRLVTNSIINCKESSIKYIVRLGTLESGGKYNLDKTVKEAIVEMLTSPCPDDSLILDFSKGVYFDHVSTAIVDYKWRINTLKRKL